MGLFDSIVNRFTSRTEINWEDLEETLIAGDLGIQLTTKVVDDLQALGRKVSGDDIIEACRKEITAILGDETPPLPQKRDGMPNVILVAGVNGTGKTTSTAKLANLLKNQGHSVLLAAADTFRAAAIEQLEVWSKRLDIPIIKTQYQADPSAVCFDAHRSAIQNKVDFLICDTAGRLHTRDNLMEELKKIQRTLKKQDDSAPHERLLVVDATTGSNALSQAKKFQETLDLTGLIVTKLDGSGKGGSAVLIKKELNIPTRFIGTGEGEDDFKPFDPQSFVENIL
ncbi:MAG: signal recognition particle-docking protein FtsY [Verrucomicrobia bacterium]|nr:signal recognition particle-docking protein FtsY [Verrucomicrobiota bacterium]